MMKTADFTGRLQRKYTSLRGVRICIAGSNGPIHLGDFVLASEEEREKGKGEGRMDTSCRDQEVQQVVTGVVSEAMDGSGRCWWVLWGWDGGGRASSTHLNTRQPFKRSGADSTPCMMCLLLVALLMFTPGSAQDGTKPTFVTPPTIEPLSSMTSNLLNTSTNAIATTIALKNMGAISETKANVNWSNECHTTLSWPKVEEGQKSIMVGFLLTRLGFRKERLGLKIPGAFSSSVEDVNNRSVLPDNYTLRFEIRDTKGLEDLGSKHLVDLLCEGVSAIFGPEHTCFVEGTIAQGQNLPMISYGCTNEQASRFTTFARTNPSEIHIIKTTVATLRHNNWTKFSIIYSEDNLSMMNTLKKEAEKENMTINHEKLYNKDRLPLIFQETKNATRIYVFIGHRSLVNEVLTVMAMTGLYKTKEVKKEYLLLFIDLEEYMPNDWYHYIWGDRSRTEISEYKRCMERDLMAYDGAFVVVANRFPESENFEDMVREYNKKEPFCFGHHESYARLDRKSAVMDKDRPITDEMHIPYLPTAYMYDSVQLYARAVSELYAAREDNDTTVEDIAKNGTKIKNHLKNITYKSLLGFNLTMNVNASSEGKYSVYYFSDCPDLSMDKFHCTKCLYKISDYYSENSSLMATAEIVDIEDEPHCGYDGLKCPVRSEGYQRLLAWVMGGLLILSIFISTILYRNWKYEQEIVGLQWRINQLDLILSSHVSVGSRQSLASAMSYDQHGQWYQNLANYKGTIVCLKGIDLNQKRPEFSRNTMKEMRNMREMKQNNVCAFIGAFVEQRKMAHGEHSRVTFVTEYCTRGSLLDILGLEDIKLDCLFISSLVHDLLKGMLFLHSHFGPHGNLKSSNCVVNGRWVLQVTDFGLYDLRCETLRHLEKDDRVQFDQRMLWRAPELLRAGIDAPGTKEGDVYSFAIILHEIIGRQGPYDTYDSDTDDSSVIIKKLKSGSTVTGPPYRPDLNKIIDMPFGSDASVRCAMQAAWEENPSDRPTFRSLRVKLKSMKDKSRKGNLMDHMVHMLEQYSKNLEDLVFSRTQQLRDEERKTKDLLHRMLPSSVAASLTQGIAVEPQGFDAVTIYFSDIVGFTSLSAESTPYEVVRFLNDLYTLFDKIIRGYDVYKVETIGDAYMVVSGLPKPNNGRHAGEVASMALELLDEVKNKFIIRHRPDKKLLLRIGLHTGPVIAGVVGLTMPRYCLFGDTVNTASRMESNGEQLKIHISKECHQALSDLGGYVMEERGLVKMKGKGEVLTYWLISATLQAIQRRDCSESLSPPLLQLSEYDSEAKRRSPRLSSMGGRTSSNPRSMDDPGDVNGGVPQFNYDEPRDSPRSEIFHRRRLSSNLRTSSIDNTPRGSLLCPPKQDSAPDIVHQSVSLDELHHSGVRLEVPALQNVTTAATPSSSEPTLPIEDGQRGVNFCPSAYNEDTSGNHGIGERDPMLKGDEVELEEQGIYTGENSPHLPGAGNKKSSKIRSWLAGILQYSRPGSRIAINKLSVNGLKRESLV
ncbi:receptor-type guanylate cyclase Gyc76C-like isoform X3 [Panulirus ornatus]|uniref:receptor-type guanylate cyclase Gyc76C-like isoform X3 n=1 Tax=Panulirus ornatus TaxID=150431 RepID=UPI003A8A7569